MKDANYDQVMTGIRGIETDLAQIVEPDSRIAKSWTKLSYSYVFSQKDGVSETQKQQKLKDVDLIANSLTKEKVIIDHRLDGRIMGVNEQIQGRGLPVSRQEVSESTDNTPGTKPSPR